MSPKDWGLQFEKSDQSHSETCELVVSIRQLGSLRSGAPNVNFRKISVRKTV